MTAIEAFRFKHSIGIVSHVQIAATLVERDVMRFQGFVDIAKSFHEKPPDGKWSTGSIVAHSPAGRQAV